MLDYDAQPAAFIASRDDNSYHVVSALEGVDETAIIDVLDRPRRHLRHHGGRSGSSRRGHVHRLWHASRPPLRLLVVNSTFSNNTAVASCASGDPPACGGGGIFCNNADLALYSSVFWGNVTPGPLDEWKQIVGPTGVGGRIQFNCIQDEVAGSDPPFDASNLDQDPLFADPPGEDGELGTADASFSSILRRRSMPSNIAVVAGLVWSSCALRRDDAGAARLAGQQRRGEK